MRRLIAVCALCLLPAPAHAVDVATYLTTLDARSEWRGPVVEVTLPSEATGGEVKLYETMMIVELPNGAFRGETQAYYVEDEGGAGETVYPVNRERENDPGSGFEAQVRTFLDGQLNATRLKYRIDQLSEQDQFVVLTVYELDTGTVSPARYFLYLDAGTPTFHPYSP